ncbi:exodeoxyribonuclease VII large subunit [Treponema peruense]|uniref:Exodeoxyribonuclease 7 large subunit n=1 Tax=Treponema peruense TaxID=2787628 RepID=A0A7T3RBS5_9SPIR|nr:exodeoxyribonuclease VII large subunit [Treponema peruense]QQA00181.1 exodeoxyribonuclease VII large subunit [Treponema peruense]
MTSAEQNNDALSVSQLTGLIKTMLEGSFSNISLKGEISNFRPNASGHLYFSLKDSDAQISAVMFRGRAASLDFTPKDGTLVVVKGSVSVYAPRGNYQIIITSMTKAGAGDILEMIEQRKRQFAQEGLFDSSRKKNIPFFPGTVGIVTSPTGAALRDILQIVRRRNDKVSIVILPALVQGEEAAPSITRMIKIANTYSLCDVLIVGRGGGSLEDLLPFSEECVVRAIANSDIPVVSAVGHEIDWALSDFAADLRASTPSAAAELTVPEKRSVTESIQNAVTDLKTEIDKRIKNMKLLLKTFTPESMELQFRNIELPVLNRFDTVQKQLEQNMQNYIEEKRRKIAQCTQILENCNPQTIFDRGYSMVCDAETGRVIRNASDTAFGKKLLIRPSKGSIYAEVTKTSEVSEQ